jgi:hypothetical protein
MTRDDLATVRPAAPQLDPHRAFVARAAALSRWIVLAGFLAAVGLSSRAAAQDPEFIASTLWSSAEAVGIVDDVAVVLFTAGMATFDVSNPTEPILLERIVHLDSLGGFTAIEIAGDRAFVTSPPNGLMVYDVSTPSHPVLLGSHAMPGYPDDLEVVGDRLYVTAGHDGGLQIFDISEPDQPRRLGGCDTVGACFAVAVWESYAYCTDGLNGIAIVDVADPAHPILVTRFGGMACPPYSIAASGGLLYTLGSWGEKSIWDPSFLMVHDLTDPINPTPRGIYQSTEGANRLSLQGNYAYIANANGSVTTVDVADPDAPVEVFETETGGYSTDICLQGDRAYVPSFGGTLAILGLDTPSAPTLLGRWWEACGTNDVSLEDGIVITADSGYGIHVVDARNPAEPRILADLSVPGRATAVTASGAFAYVAADSAGVFALDISDPSDPRIVGQVDQDAVDIEYDGGFLYTVARNQGMRVINARDPEHLQVVAVCPVPGWPSSVSVAKGFAAVTNGTDVYVIDISDPRHPVIRGRYDPPEHAFHVTFDGTWAYVCAGWTDLLVINAANPDAPVYETELHFNGNTLGSTLDGTLLYLPAAGLQVIDVSDPRNPRVTGSSAMGAGSRVAVEGSVACIASGNSLDVYWLDPSSGVDQPPAHPAIAGADLRVSNPVRGSAEVLLRLDRSCFTRLEVLDVAGRCVDRLYHGHAGQGELRLCWNADRLPAGMYYLRLVTEEGVTCRQVTLLP